MRVVLYVSSELRGTGHVLRTYVRHGWMKVLMQSSFCHGASKESLIFRRSWISFCEMDVISSGL